MTKHLSRAFAAFVLVGATAFAGTALAFYELTDSTSDSTSSTSDITTGDHSGATVAQQTYLQHNYFNVARDAAVGGGEHLGALGTLLGCDEVVRSRLYERTKLNHARIFRPGTNAAATLVTAKRVLGEDAVIAASCRHVARVIEKPAP